MATTLHDTETTCHCGADYKGSDHCPQCYCEQYESTSCGYLEEQDSMPQTFAPDPHDEQDALCEESILHCDKCSFSTDDAESFSVHQEDAHTALGGQKQ